MSAPPTIIIVEPDPLIRNVLRVEFSQLTFAVLLPANGPEAEDFATRTVASLVVLDAGLSRLSGYDACARIRRQPGYRDTPIVLTARDLSPKIQAAAGAAGATATLGKPYAFNDLLDTISPHLPPDNPLLTTRPKGFGLSETAWGRPATLEWKFGSDSGLSRNKAVMTIVRSKTVRIPLIRST
ncbi:response regulator transcription factor [Rhodopila sp.]|uniref:response regulator transcription factor n=1 Tax=Rhodopila sp. TaxID=2480087 RepID=UPI003D13E406